MDASLTGRGPLPQRRRRWRLVLIILLLLILVPAGFVGYLVVSTRLAWARAEEEASRDLPRWRLLEMEADRRQVPDEENSALHIMAVVGKAPGLAVIIAPNYKEIFEKLPPNTQFNAQQEQLIRAALAKIAGPLAEARRLKDMPQGRFPIRYTDDYISTPLTEQQKARDVAEWLQHDAWLLAHDGQYDDALESCQAILCASRAFHDELFSIAFLIRVALQSVTVDSLERVLAQGESSDERLRTLQGLLEEEAAQNAYLQLVRGERAGYHQLFDNIRDGNVSPTAFRGIGGNTLAGWTTNLAPSVVLAFYPEFLRYMNRMVDDAKLPRNERSAKMKALENETRRSKNPLVASLIPGTARILHEVDCRSQGVLCSAFVALACERYRLKHQHWPETLEILVKEKLLTTVPPDPMDNQPLRYRRTTDGVVVYSIGFDLTDNQGHIDRDNARQPGVDVGFRLWDPDKRRQAPLPPVVLPQ